MISPLIAQPPISSHNNQSDYHPSLLHRSLQSSPLPQDHNQQSRWNIAMGLGKQQQQQCNNGCNCCTCRDQPHSNPLPGSNYGTPSSPIAPPPPSASSHWQRLNNNNNGNNGNNGFKCYEVYQERPCGLNYCLQHHQYTTQLRFVHDCNETAARDDETTGTITASTRSTASPPSHLASFDLSPRQLLYRGPIELPEIQHMRIYDCLGPVCFQSPSVQGCQHTRAELRQWPHHEDLIISQNSSKRKVHRGIWLSPLYPDIAFPVAVKFVEDSNARDGRSIKREIECHLFIYQRLHEIQKIEGYAKLEDAWPSAELLGYHLDKKNPGRCMLVTRKLSGPDFFDVIKESYHSQTRVKLSDEFHKLHWCSIALKRVQQYATLGIRHNDIKPDNIVIDWYLNNNNQKCLDVKIIDLGTASMHHAKDFTGGTSWYESPEQKILEYYSKKQRNQEAAKKVDIGLSSDVWATGLSIAEVLVGRRVVDALKQPNGPGPLDYRGPVEGWGLEPDEWLQLAREALFSGPRKSTSYMFCYDAARWIYDNLVRTIASDRATLQDAIDVLNEQSEFALRRSKRTPTTRSMA